MKLLTVIFSCFNRHDTKGFCPDNFESYQFNNFPVVYNAMAIYHMVSTKPYDNKKRSHFSSPETLLTDVIKTKIFNYYLPRRFKVERLDPTIIETENDFNSGYSDPYEPNNWEYRLFFDFLKNEFYQSDYQHVIYRSRLGQPPNLVEEDRDRLYQPAFASFRYLVDILQEQVFPLLNLDDTAIFLHNDHGTFRSYLDYEAALFDGFFLMYLPPGKNTPSKFKGKELDWLDIRNITAALFGVDNKIPNMDNIYLF